MPGVPLARSLACKNEKARRVSPPQVRRRRSGIPRAMVLTGSFVLSPVIGLCCHRRLADMSARLGIGVEMPGPHDFAVRIWRTRLAHLTRPPHPEPTFSDDRETPLFTGHGTRGNLPVICPTSQMKLPAAIWHDGQISWTRFDSVKA